MIQDKLLLTACKSLKNSHQWMSPLNHKARSYMHNFGQGGHTSWMDQHKKHKKVRMWEGFLQLFLKTANIFSVPVKIKQTGSTIRKKRKSKLTDTPYQTSPFNMRRMKNVGLGSYRYINRISWSFKRLCQHERNAVFMDLHCVNIIFQNLHDTEKKKTTETEII